MFSLLGRWLVSPVRRRVLLSSSTTSRLVHSMQAPYAGPPSYDTIARRLSSDVKPQAYYSRRRQQQALERGELVDIHDVGGLDLKDFLITDIDHNRPQHEVAGIVGIPYVFPASKVEADKVITIGECFIFTRKARTIFPAVVAHPSGKGYWVFFLVNTCMPLTYLSAQDGNPTAELRIRLITRYLGK